MIEFRLAKIEDAEAIALLVKPVWQDTYSPIIEQDQVDYMFNLLYDLTVLKKHIETGTQNFILAEKNNTLLGIAGIGYVDENTKHLKLHKLYIKLNQKGSGLGKKLIEKTIEFSKNHNESFFRLNVNRYNPALGFYKHLGFEVLYETDIQIGPYWMNDYVMELQF